jgi:hypothetical protein
MLKPHDLSALVSCTPTEVSVVDVPSHHKYLLFSGAKVTLVQVDQQANGLLAKWLCIDLAWVQDERIVHLMQERECQLRSRRAAQVRRAATDLEDLHLTSALVVIEDEQLARKRACAARVIELVDREREDDPPQQCRTARWVRQTLRRRRRARRSSPSRRQSCGRCRSSRSSYRSSSSKRRRTSGTGIGATSGARARARAAGGYCVLALGRALRIAYCVLRIGAKGQVGFPIRLGGVSYTIRILMYLDVSCVYPEGYMYPLCILMYLKCILPALLHSKRIHVS